MRGLQLLLLGIVAALVGLATSNVPAELLGLAALLVVLLAWGYRRLLGGRIRSIRAVSASVIPWGGVLAESITIGNTSRLSASGMRVVDEATLPAHPRGYVATLPAKRTITWDLAVPCQQRGRFTVGPLQVTTSDPLGLLPFERLVESGQSVLVLPRYVPLTRCFFAMDGLIPGTARGRARGEAPPAIAGIRAYQPSDALARIHWPASARSGQLMSKQFEPETQTTFWLALDLDRPEKPARQQKSSAAEFVDPIALPDAEELLVTAAASLGLYALGQVGLNVGLIASGAHPIILAPERGPGRQRRLLEALAEVQMGHQATLREYVGRMERQLAAQHTVVLLTARPAATWSSWLHRLLRRGVAVRVVAVDRVTDTHEAVAAAWQASNASGWPVPAITLPVALADPAHAEDLIHALESSTIAAPTPTLPTETPIPTMSARP